MTVQVLEEFEVGSFHASALTDTHADSLWATSVSHACSFEDEAEGLYLLAVDRSKCAKGVMVALTLEAGAALCFYGLWHLWHVLL
jgi:hypothetical protein